MVLGVKAFVQKWLVDKEGFHLQLLSSIPAVQDAQSAWLLLLMCAGPGANHILRATCPLQRCPISARTMITTCELALQDIIAMPVRDGVNGRGGAVALPGRRVGPWECSHSGASGLRGVLGRLLVTGWTGRHPELSVFGKPNTLPQ